MRLAPDLDTGPAQLGRGGVCEGCAAKPLALLQRREKQAANTDVATVRAARDQLRAARSRPIPRVTASSYNTLIELTNKLLKGGAPGVRGGEDTQEAMRVQDQLVKCCRSTVSFDTSTGGKLSRVGN